MTVSFQEIGKRASSRRSQLGLSQELVAERMGISRQVYGKIENGQKAINAIELQGILTALSMPLEELLREEPKSLGLLFMGQATTPEAQRAIQIIDDLAREYSGQYRVARRHLGADQSPN